MAPVDLTAAGFTSAGIPVGSMTASMMSTAAVAGGGGVAAVLQSVEAVVDTGGAFSLGGFVGARIVPRIVAVDEPLFQLWKRLLRLLLEYDCD